MESRSYSWGDDINKLDEVAARIRDGGGRAEVVRIYVSSKHAIRGLTRSAAKQYAAR
jgi:hypothetical protein